MEGVERSDCENRIKMCIRKVTKAKPNAKSAMPFHEYRSEDHWRNFRAPNISRHAQEVTTYSSMNELITVILKINLATPEQQNEKPPRLKRSHASAV